MTKRAHYDLIIAWANGADIQIKVVDNFLDISNPDFIENIEYRIKPETIKYKRYIYKLGSFHLGTSNFVDPEFNPEAYESFVRWIDKEWQEIEI